MRALRPVLGLLLLTMGGALAVVFSTAPPAAACSCVSGNQADLLEWSDVVFTGEVVDVERVDRHLVHRFAVDRVYQGDAGERAEVATGADGAACGLGRLRVGTAYIVYATVGDDGALATGACSGTERERPASLERLQWTAGAGERPAGGDPAPGGTGPTAAGPDGAGPVARPVALGLVGGGAAVVIATGLLLGRRRSQTV